MSRKHLFVVVFMGLGLFFAAQGAVVQVIEDDFSSNNIGTVWTSTGKYTVSGGTINSTPGGTGSTTLSTINSVFLPGQTAANGKPVEKIVITLNVIAAHPNAATVEANGMPTMLIAIGASPTGNPSMFTRTQCLSLEGRAS